MLVVNKLKYNIHVHTYWLRLIPYTPENIELRYHKYNRNFLARYPRVDRIEIPESSWAQI